MHIMDLKDNITYNFFSMNEIHKFDHKFTYHNNRLFMTQNT